MKSKKVIFPARHIGIESINCFLYCVYFVDCVVQKLNYILYNYCFTDCSHLFELNKGLNLNHSNSAY